jgi:hypothetical protein
MPQKPLTPEIFEVAENVKKNLPNGVLHADLVTTADGGWAIEVGRANRDYPVPCSQFATDRCGHSHRMTENARNENSILCSGAREMVNNPSENFFEGRCC